MNRSRQWDGCAALMLVLTAEPDGKQRSLFRNSHGRGLNIITLSMMPKHMPISLMETWLRAFQRSHWPASIATPLPGRGR